MTAVSIVNWFAHAYRAVGLDGCSSHSGRRTFITRAARLVHKAGGSLRDYKTTALMSNAEGLEAMRRAASCGYKPVQAAASAAAAPPR